MPKLSPKKIEKISEQILLYLFSISPEAAYTSTIASEIARDEEFTKSLLENLKEKNLIVEIKKSKHGLVYAKRQRWRLSNKVYEIYKKHQTNPLSYSFDEDILNQQSL